jgi:hypothetical protein
VVLIFVRGPLCGRKNFSNDTIGNRIRDLPSFSSVPQTNALLCTPKYLRIADILGGDWKHTRSEHICCGPYYEMKATAGLDSQYVKWRKGSTELISAIKDHNGTVVTDLLKELMS